MEADAGKFSELDDDTSSSVQSTCAPSSSSSSSRVLDMVAAIEANREVPDEKESVWRNLFTHDKKQKRKEVAMLPDKAESLMRLVCVTV